MVNQPPRPVYLTPSDRRFWFDSSNCADSRCRLNWLKASWKNGGMAVAGPGYAREVDAELDLNAASRETLLEIIAGQRAVIADLQRELVLTRIPSQPVRVLAPASVIQLHSSPSKRRRNIISQKAAPPWLIARQTHDSYQRVEHAVAVCPDCGTHLNGGWVSELGKSLSYRWLR